MRSRGKSVAQLEDGGSTLFRSQDSNLLAVASYVHQEDSVIDVGGGAGRVSLPLGLRCREVINVDPSSGMKAEFEESAAEAGLSNTQFVQSDWSSVVGVSGDLVITANLTYFVRDGSMAAS